MLCLGCEARRGGRSTFDVMRKGRRSRTSSYVGSRRNHWPPFSRHRWPRCHSCRIRSTQHSGTWCRVSPARCLRLLASRKTDSIARGVLTARFTVKALSSFWRPGRACILSIARLLRCRRRSRPTCRVVIGCVRTTRVSSGSHRELLKRYCVHLGKEEGWER